MTHVSSIPVAPAAPSASPVAETSVHPHGIGARGTSVRKINALYLHEFRSYRHLFLERDLLDQSRIIVLTGDNGVGKTNLLEAVSMLNPGRGLRRAGLQQLIRRQSDGSSWSVQAAICDDIGETIVATALSVSRNGRESRGRNLRIDNAPAESFAQLAHIAPMLWLTPAIERAIAESASGRRRFLDRIVMSLEPDHGSHSTSYERAMRERNRLLQTSGNAAWLEGLEKAMAREGAWIQAARRRTVAMLSTILQEQSLPDFPRARIAIAPNPDASEEAVVTDGCAEAMHEEENRLRARFREMRLLDRRAGRALVGPHRCDLRIFHQIEDGEMPLQLSSSGEQKALLLGLVLAHGRLLADTPRGVPILLLDEVAAHLDAVRRQALFDILAQSGAHSWMTGVDPSLFDACHEDSCFLSVSPEGVFPTNRAPVKRTIAKLDHVAPHATRPAPNQH